jgi:cyclic pyranopterin phosphate synthase
MDSYGRIIDYLRISVTDRCNERCVYCMPEGFRGWQKRSDILQAGEIIRIARVAAGLGFRKFRLTGGEPLVRDDLVEIVRGIHELPGVSCIGLSTNGTRLAQAAQNLRAAGLRTVNISLDALNPALYHRITGGHVETVLDGLQAAQAAGFERIKLNCVLMRGVNEGEIWPLIRFAAQRDLPLRLIELMPLSRTDVLNEENFLSVAEVMEMLRRDDVLEPQPNLRIGHGPARYYRLKNAGALVGFIGALTVPHFCETCNRMRLTSDGKIRPCLGNHEELDLRALLRSGASDGELAGALQEALRQKPPEHQFRCSYQPRRPMVDIGG